MYISPRSALNLGYPSFPGHPALALNSAAAAPLLGLRLRLEPVVPRARLVILAPRPLLELRCSRVPRRSFVSSFQVREVRVLVSSPSLKLLCSIIDFMDGSAV